MAKRRKTTDTVASRSRRSEDLRTDPRRRTMTMDQLDASLRRERERQVQEMAQQANARRERAAGQRRSQLTPAERRRALGALLLLQSIREGRTVNGQISAGRQGTPRRGQ